MKDYYITHDTKNKNDKIAFVHGHKPFLEVFDKKVKTIVSGHLHPSVIIGEKPGVKRETYKCFLTGNFKGKIMIVVPSFLGFTEGTPVNDYPDNYIESFSIIFLVSAASKISHLLRNSCTVWLLLFSIVTL